MWNMRQAHIPHHTLKQGRASGAHLIHYVMGKMREAHFSHNIMNFCAAWPREHLSSKGLEDQMRSLGSRAQNASVAPVEHTCYTSSNVQENTGGKREKLPGTR